MTFLGWLVEQLTTRPPAATPRRQAACAPRGPRLAALGGAATLVLALGGGCQPVATEANKPVFSPDSATVQVAANATYAQRGWLWQRLWGQHYRAQWATPVAAPVLRLKALGLVPQRLGGSFQTQSLHLRDAAGRSLVLRSVDKDLSHMLDGYWVEDVLAPVLRDQTCAAPPYGAPIVAELARAAGVPHTSPRLYYLPATEALGAWQVRPGLYMLEERPDGPQAASYISGASRVVGSEAMLRELLAGTGASLDARAYLRARLLDVLVGDWSRRADQWRWAAVADAAGHPVFQPVPRDRDQAFFRFDDGWLTRAVSWVRPRFQTFNPHLVPADVRPLTVSARPLDHTALGLVPEAAFVAEADSLVRHLPDAALRRALGAAPAAVQARLRRELLPALQARRAALPAIARRFYEVLQEEPVLLGTAAAERFELVALGPGRVLVRQWARRPLRPDSLLGERAYTVARTTRLTIYGLGGNDVFELRGALRPGFGVHLHGGAGRNQFLQETLMQPLGPGLTIYPTPADLVQVGSGVRELTGPATDTTTTWLTGYYRLKLGSTP